MKRNSNLILLVAIAVAATLMSVAVACSSDDNDDGDATPPEATAGDAEVLHIELNEWSIAGEDGGPIPSAGAGNVTFEVHNEGETVHELVIVKTDTDPASLPLDGSKVDEDAAGDLIGEVEEFAAGEIETGAFDLEAGAYALICNIPAHYEQGMYAQLTVQ